MSQRHIRERANPLYQLSRSSAGEGASGARRERAARSALGGRSWPGRWLRPACGRAELPPPPRGLTLALMLTLTLLASLSPPHARAAEAERAPLLWASLGGLGGEETLSTQEGGFKTTLELLPQLTLGGAHWWGDALGLWIEGRVGVGGTIELPPALGGSALSLNYHRLLGGARYRWRWRGARGPTLSVGSGLELSWRSAAAQQPLFITNQQRFIPQLELRGEVPLGALFQGALHARAGRTLLVREEEGDSGRFDGGTLFALGATVNLELLSTLALYLGGEWSQEELRFTGFGRRMSGVTGAREERQLIQLSLGLRQRL